MSRALPPSLRFALPAAIGVAIWTGFAMAAPAPLAIVNETPSVPRGLYVRSPGAEPQLGSLVTIAPPAAARPYLARLRVPSDMRLLKRVAAVGGERVCVAAGHLRTPRAMLIAPHRDRRGVALPAWQGCRTLAADEVLLLGDTPTSFDGRYFGPVRRGDLEGVYRRVLRW